MNLTELSKQIRFDNASKGFDPTEGGIDRYLLLAISEICEAQNELRDGRRIDEIYYELISVSGKKIEAPNWTGFSHKKPCGFPVEIADAIIRLLDICGKFDIEIQIPEFTSYRFTESIDYYLLGVCNLISNCQHGIFVGIRTYRFQHSLQSAICALYHLCIHNKIEIEKVINEKLTFNKSRPPKHGRKF